MEQVPEVDGHLSLLGLFFAFKNRRNSVEEFKEYIGVKERQGEA